MPGAFLQQRIHGVMIPDIITVLFAGGVEARVELLRRPHRGQDADVVRQKSIEREREPGSGHLEPRRKESRRGRPCQRMDPGIACGWSCWMRFTPGNIFAEGRLDFLLHAGADLLDLPALVGGAVVGDDEFEFQRVHGKI